MTFVTYDLVPVRSETMMFASYVGSMAPYLNHVGRFFFCKNLSLLCKKVVEQIAESAGSDSEWSSSCVQYLLH